MTLGPFHNRAAELELYTPLVGKTMLELGGKINYPHVYKAYFEALGYRHVSVDWNGAHGALPLDLREPLNLGQFDFVSNIGTTEHVDGQHGVWKNICDAMHVGSVLVSTTPLPGQWKWHGDWYPTEEFYAQLAAYNELSVDRLYISGEKPRQMIFARLTRQREAAFRMPDSQTIFHNIRSSTPAPQSAQAGGS